MDTMDVEQLIGWDSLLHEDEKMVRVRAYLDSAMVARLFAENPV